MSKTEFRNVSTKKTIDKFNQVARHSEEESKKYKTIKLNFF